jgi:hypothetical protein
MMRELASKEEEVLGARSGLKEKYALECAKQEQDFQITSLKANISQLESTVSGLQGSANSKQ